jgi:hypothetical protein
MEVDTGHVDLNIDSNINTSSGLKSSASSHDTIFGTGSITNMTPSITSNHDDILPLDRFNIRKVPGDGSCFYHSIIDQLDYWYHIEINHLDLRNDSNLWLRNNVVSIQNSAVNSKYYKKYAAYLSDDVKWTRYIDEFSDPIVYAEDPHIQGVCEILRLRICIHSSNEPTRVIIPVTQVYAKTVYIYLTPARSHFDSLILSAKVIPKSSTKSKKLTSQQESLGYNTSRASIKYPFHIILPNKKHLYNYTHIPTFNIPRKLSLLTDNKCFIL